MMRSVSERRGGAIARGRSYARVCVGCGIVPNLRPVPEPTEQARSAEIVNAIRQAIPEGTLPVGIGLLVAGTTSYAFLVLSARGLGPARYATLSALWALVFVAGPGFFIPFEQDVSRAVAARHARHVGA